ncbi:RbsD/FucU family protein [Roseicyclus sp.]|uniref:RbsD/FucU family protein n=1 Tax=Roseicyclus sp. TaxID=1914329 RepID=UPI003F6CBD01
MLIGLDPVLGPELLAALRAMGHGDEIAIVDGNYPAAAHAHRLIRADGLPVPRVLAAVLSVLPLDGDVPHPALRSCDPARPDRPDPVHRAMDEILQSALHDPAQIAVTHGPVFYDRVKHCYAVVATGELALFANVILRKGVVEPQSSHETTPR